MADDNFSWHAFQAVPREFPGQQVDALREEVERLKEASLDGLASYDPDINLSPQGGGSLYFNRLSQGTRELNPLQQERATELAYFLYESNPLGKAIVETTRDFVLGDSVTVTSQDPATKRRTEQQDVLDTFWNDSINLMDIKLQNKVMELGLFGEQCYPVEINPVDGFIRLGYIDPGNIKDILVDPHNVERQLAVITYTRGSAANPDEERWYKIIAPEDDATDPWYGRLKGVETNYLPADGEPDPSGSGRSGGSTSDTITWRDHKGNLLTHKVEGSCFYFTVNKVSNSKRGRTDLLSLVDWVDSYDQLLFNEIDRGLLLKAFIWDVNLEGYNDTQIEAYKKGNPQPRPASVRYHNEKVEWKAVTPDLKAADSAAAADLILSYIATGARLPKTWLNGMADVNRATAQELGAPALARLSLRQKLVKYMVAFILTFVLDNAEMKGMVTKRPRMGRGSLKPKAWVVHVNLPDLKQVNQITVAQAINNVVVGLGLAVQQKMIDLNLAREVVVMFIEQMGVEVNLTQLNESLGNVMPPPPVGAGTGNDPGSATNTQNSGTGGKPRNLKVAGVKGTGRNIKEAGAGADEPLTVDTLLDHLNNLSRDPHED